jgi:hypothetical protein
MDKRKAHLEALPAWQLREDLEALQRSFYTFNTNADELATHVGQFLSSSEIAREISDDYVNELVRRLHNYLTSVTSLIDSQRVVMRHRWPMPSREDKSEFEANDYSRKLADTFETGEGVFMSKLRNYCTHYSIPLPDLTTTMTWEQGMHAPRLVNTLQLDRDRLLRWDSWTAPAREYLNRQPAYFNLAPIVERYVNAAGRFAAWFWAEINSRSTALIDELTTKAMELKLWHDEQVGTPEWIDRGERHPPPGWNGRLWRPGQRKTRYEYGSRGFRVWAVDTDGVIVLAKDDDWARHYPRATLPRDRRHRWWPSFDGLLNRPVWA